MAKGPDHIDYEETPDLTEVHAAIQREHRDPTAKVTPVPLWVTLLCGAAVCWAGAYVGMFHGGFDSSIYDEFKSSPDRVFGRPLGSRTKQDAGPAAPESLITVGKQVYGQVCQACHQPSGLGMPGAIPPLAGSEWVMGNEKITAMIVLKGLQGPITVGKTTFNGVMPGQEGALSDKKIAAVLSYVRQEWGNKAPEITPEQIKNARAELSGRATPYTEPELKQVPPETKLEGGAPPGGVPASSSAAPAAPATAAANVAPASSVTGPAPTASAAPAAVSSTTPSAAAPPAPAALITSASASPPATPAGPAATPEQLAQGKTLYLTVCFACHQATGAGLPPVFPSIVKSDYVNGSAKRLVAMVLKGINPPFTYKGASYVGVMLPQEALLDDAKIASILTYVRASFENSAPPVSAEFVASVRKELLERKTPWTQAELDNWKDDAVTTQAAAR